MEIEVIGWIGTFLVVSAFWAGPNDLPGRLYHTVNFLGAVCIGVNVAVAGAWPALALQVIWGGISVWKLLTKNSESK